MTTPFESRPLPPELELYHAGDALLDELAEDLASPRARAELDEDLPRVFALDADALLECFARGDVS